MIEGYGWCASVCLASVRQFSAGVRSYFVGFRGVAKAFRGSPGLVSQVAVQYIGSVQLLPNL